MRIPQKKAVYIHSGVSGQNMRLEDYIVEHCRFIAANLWKVARNDDWLKNRISEFAKRCRNQGADLFFDRFPPEYQSPKLKAVCNG